MWEAFEDMEGGEIYVRKIPSMTITDIAEAVAPGKPTEVVGIRPGEKLHEQMIGEEDAPNTYEYRDFFKILPTINTWSPATDMVKGGTKVPDGFLYTSDTNTEWMTPAELRGWMDAHFTGDNHAPGAQH